MSENIFEKRDQEVQEEYKQLGLGDINVSAAHLIKIMTIREIEKNNITDEAEKLQMYQKVKHQYMEYSQYAGYNIPEKPSEISQLREEVKQLDKRLKRLEKYTQE
jgi:hypothetical protein